MYVQLDCNYNQLSPNKVFYRFTNKKSCKTVSITSHSDELESKNNFIIVQAIYRPKQLNFLLNL